MKKPNKSRRKIQELKRLASSAKKQAQRIFLRKISRRAFDLMMDKQWRFIPDRAPQASIDGLVRAIEIKSKTA